MKYINLKGEKYKYLIVDLNYYKILNKEIDLDSSIFFFRINLNWLFHFFNHSDHNLSTTFKSTIISWILDAYKRYFQDR